MPIYDTAQWVKLQDQDVVLHRIKELMKLDQLDQIKDNVEIPDVEKLSKERGSLVMDDDGILCCKLFAHVERQPIQALQRLVPHEMRIVLISQVHKDDCRHMGLDCVFAQLYKHFYWSGMRDDIRSWLVACESCQRHKPGVGRGRIEIQHERVAKQGH